MTDFTTLFRLDSTLLIRDTSIVDKEMIMTLRQAYKILDKECDFLGVDWDRIMYMLRYNPMIFPQRALDAYAVILREEDYWMEE